MKRAQSPTHEFWIAIGVSVAFHVLAGSVFWITWERTMPENTEIDVEWTWTAPTSGKMEPGRSEPAKSGGERVPVPGAQPSNDLPSSGSVSDTKNTPPSSERAGLKETAPATGPAPVSTSPIAGLPAVGLSASPLPSSGELPGYEASAAGESKGYALVPPRLRERPAIQLSAEAVQAGLSGNVLLLAEVLENGRVGKIVVTRSSGSKILDESARENVSRWRFEPAFEPQEKKPVRVMTSVWVRYSKEGS